MRFVFGKQDMTTLERAQERCWLLANGLGGYMSATAAFSVTRRDHSILMAAVTPPAGRIHLVHRLSETLAVGERDMAYHQGTVWPYPLGAYYVAYLKTRGSSPAAARTVREQLEPMEAILREGCVGQIPEIYDGGNPGPSKGCFAQAWSVGELLRVYEKLEEIEKEDSGHAG